MTLRLTIDIFISNRADLLPQSPASALVLITDRVENYSMVAVRDVLKRCYAYLTFSCLP